MIGLPVILNSLVNFRSTWNLIGQVKGISIEKSCRTDRRVVGPGIHRQIFGRSIQINDIATELGDQKTGAQFLHEVIELFNMPISVLNLKRSWHHSTGERRRQLAPAMWHAHQQRQVALIEFEDH